MMNLPESTMVRLKGIIKSNRGMIIPLAVVAFLSVLMLLIPSFSEAMADSVYTTASAAAESILKLALHDKFHLTTALNEVTGVGYTEAGSFFSFKFILWTIVISLVINSTSSRNSYVLTGGILILIFLLSTLRLVLSAVYHGEGNIFTAGDFSLPYRITLFLLPVCFLPFKAAEKGIILKPELLAGWRDNHFIIFIVAAAAGSLPGLLYGSGFFLFDWVIRVVFTMAKTMLSVFSVTSSFTGRYLTNDHTSIFMSDSCAGLKTIFMLISLIFLGRGKTFPKISFAASGVFFLLILNAIRVTILFEINNEGAPAQVFEWWHSNFKYLFYIAVILIWMLWMRITAE